MCYFRKLLFLCGCDKLKIFKACDRTAINVQNEIYCQDDPHPHIDDNVERTYAYPVAHGPGVCSNIHCRWKFGLLPLGVYREDKASLAENDAEFDMSEEARKEREDQWYRILSTDQQFDYLSMTFPLPVDSMSEYAQAHFNPDLLDGFEVFYKRYKSLSADQLGWYELNPRHMTAEQLRFATGTLLPAKVTISGNREAYASTPHMPLEGPFMIGAHICKPVLGIYRQCGRNAGDPRLRNAMVEHELDASMSLYEHPVRPSHSDAYLAKLLQKVDDARQNPDKYIWDEDLQTNRRKPAFPAGADNERSSFMTQNVTDTGDNMNTNADDEPIMDETRMDIDFEL